MATKTDAANRAVRQILEILPYVMRVMASEMRRSNPLVVPAHFRLLGMLAHRSWTLTEMADCLAVSPPTISNTVTTLEERGWVTRVRSEEDRRVVVIQTTEEGRRVLQTTYRRAESHLTTLIEALEPAEQELLAQGLDVLRRVFEHAIPTCPVEDSIKLFDKETELL